MPLQLLSVTLAFTSMSVGKFAAVITLANIPIDLAYMGFGLGITHSLGLAIFLIAIGVLAWVLTYRFQNHRLEQLKTALPSFRRLDGTP